VKSKINAVVQKFLLHADVVFWADDDSDKYESGDLSESENELGKDKKTGSSAVATSCELCVLT